MENLQKVSKTFISQLIMLYTPIRNPDYLTTVARYIYCSAGNNNLDRLHIESAIFYSTVIENLRQNLRQCVMCIRSWLLLKWRVDLSMPSVNDVCIPPLSRMCCLH